MKKKDKNIETQSEIRGQTKDAVTIDDTINQPYTDREKKKLRNDITHKLRFEILERDDYTCQYCGRKSPDVELTVDHRKPIAEGGNNDEDNLITACYECNEGKKNKRLKQDIKETDFSNMDKPQISEVILSGKIKEYFLSDESEKNRTLLHEYWKYTEGEETECPQNCESCISIGNRYYMDCFSELKRRAFPNNIITEAVAIRAKVNPIVHKSTLMQCDKCYLGDRCPLFKVAAECSYDFTLNTNFTDTESAWEIIANAQKERMSRALLFEKVDGGVADKNVSDEIDRMANILGDLDA